MGMTALNMRFEHKIFGEMCKIFAEVTENGAEIEWLTLDDLETHYQGTLCVPEEIKATVEADLAAKGVQIGWYFYHKDDLEKRSYTPKFIASNLDWDDRRELRLLTDEDVGAALEKLVAEGKIDRADKPGFYQARQTRH